MGSGLCVDVGLHAVGSFIGAGVDTIWGVGVGTIIGVGVCAMFGVGVCPALGVGVGPGAGGRVEPVQKSSPTTNPVMRDRSGVLPWSSVYTADTTTLPPGSSPHTSRTTSKLVGVASRSVAEKVTVLLVPDVVVSMGTPNSMVTVAPVDGQDRTVPPSEERMLSKAAEGWAL